MTVKISDQQLSQFSEFVTARFGLHFPRKRWRDLARIVVFVTEDFGYTDAAACIQWLIAAQLTKNQLDILADRLTVGETYFFREQKSFDLLETRILPALIDSRRGKEQRLRIWSAGCSTGEEAYSIAIMLQRMIADLPRWNVAILATDVNPVSLRKAVSGEYSDWSFRGIPSWIRERYFSRNGEGRFDIADPIRKMVTFAQLNLAEDPYPSLANNTNAMDVIFCRNVLMYFAPQQMAKVIENLRHSLVPGGWLIVSPCETSHTLFSRFETVSLQDAIFYRKNGERKPVAVLPTLETVGAAVPFPLPVIAPPPPVKVLPATPALQHPAISRFSTYEEALALYRQGLYAEAAMKLLAQVEELHGPASSEKAVVLLARIFANQGDFAKALEWSEKAIAVNKLDPEVRYLQAIILQEQGEIEAAVTVLKKTLYLDQGFVLAHFALANLSLQRGRMKEAARHLENAATLLSAYGDDEVLPGSDGMSARRLGEIIAATMTNAVNQ